MASEDADPTEVAETKQAEPFVRQDIKTLRELEKDALCDYIERLHDLLATYDHQIADYHRNLTELRLKLETFETREATKSPPTEAQDSAALEKPPDTEAELAANLEELATTEAFDFVNEIRQVAEQAQSLNDFIYEPTSGLYYDQKSGYYYDATYGLYYDGNTGCYYSYNQTSKNFEFHSQVPVQRTQEAEQDDAHNDNYDDEVEFDESGGVITDPEHLRQIKAEKERLREQKMAQRRRVKSQNVETGEEEKSKRRKPAIEKVPKKRKEEGEDEKKSRASASAIEGGERESDRRRSKSEEGELSPCSSVSSARSAKSGSHDHSSDSESESKNKVKHFKASGRFQDIARKYPPSLRIIVQETFLETLKVGSLSLITYKGGSLGREGNHDVIVPDPNVSKRHLRFHYNHKSGLYQCLDEGSRNGTILNGTRMSSGGKGSDVVHGSVLQVGQTKLLCHVHEGNSTCGLCEPGLLIEPPREPQPNTPPTQVTLTHKEQLKKLQRKYGLENEKFVDGKPCAGSYNDRAATRRVKVGSSNGSEKTQIASVDTAISSENKGFKMLSKLGWSTGEALGKTSSSGGALLEPINVASNEGTKGLGCTNPAPASLSQADKRKIEKWQRVQERYKKTDIFGGDSD